MLVISTCLYRNLKILFLEFLFNGLLYLTLFYIDKKIYLLDKLTSICKITKNNFLKISSF